MCARYLVGERFGDVDGKTYLHNYVASLCALNTQTSQFNGLVFFIFHFVESLTASEEICM